MSQRGFTLFELIVAIVIISIGVTGFIRLMISSTANSIDPMIRQQAHSIAQSYLEEALLSSFCDPDLLTDCPAACIGGGGACGNAACTIADVAANRPIFDDVCDYDVINDTAGAVDRLGNPILGLESYNVVVNVLDNIVLDDTSSVNDLDGANGEVVRVDVIVTSDDAQNLNVTLSAYKANF